MTDTIEPINYFENLKNGIDTTIPDKLVNAQKLILSEIQKAKDLNQVILANQLLFTYKVTQKELIAVSNGFNKYIDSKLLQSFVDKVIPQNSVKAMDLDKYPRIIPDENAEIIVKAKELNFFDSFCIIFTDLEDIVTRTKEDEEFVSRNRDPIVLGYFYDKQYDTKYDRYYLITDWEDEYCDLTFDKMVRTISEQKIPKNDTDVGSIDINNIEEYINKQMGILYKKPQYVKKSGVLSTIKSWFK